MSLEFFWLAMGIAFAGYFIGDGLKKLALLKILVDFD